jgi:hypothetical protein
MIQNFRNHDQGIRERLHLNKLFLERRRAPEIKRGVMMFDGGVTLLIENPPTAL